MDIESLNFISIIYAKDTKDKKIYSFKVNELSYPYTKDIEIKILALKNLELEKELKRKGFKEKFKRKMKIKKDEDILNYTKNLTSSLDNLENLDDEEDEFDF